MVKMEIVHAELASHEHGSLQGKHVHPPRQRHADADLPGLQSHVRYSIFKERRHVEHFPRGGKRTGNLAVVEWSVNRLLRGGLCSCSARKICAAGAPVKGRGGIFSKPMPYSLLRHCWLGRDGHDSSWTACHSPRPPRAGGPAEIRLRPRLATGPGPPPPDAPDGSSGRAATRRRRARPAALTAGHQGPSVRYESRTIEQ